MEYSKMVVTGFFLNVLLIGMAISTTEAIYSTHQNVSVGRFKNTSMCGVFALTQDEKTFHISSDAHLIDPPCSLYLIGVNIINNNYSLSGMCYKMSDIALPCARNDTLILREWDLDIGHKDQSILLYANQSMLVTEKTLRCDSNQDFTMNYEFCRKELSMIEILFYSPNNPSSVLPKITVQSRVLIGPTYPPLSLYDMETMKIQMDECKTCKVTAHQMYIDFLDRVILIANNNNKINNKNEDKNEEETSSASVDLNILLPSLFGSLATVAVAVVGAWKGIKVCRERAAESSNNIANGDGNQNTQSGKPVVTRGAESYTVEHGKSIKLDCTVVPDTGIINVSWTKLIAGCRQENVAPSNTAKYSESKNPPSLTIKSASQSDVATYFCSVTNEIGMGSSLKIDLKVVGGKETTKNKNNVVGTPHKGPTVTGPSKNITNGNGSQNTQSDKTRETEKLLKGNVCDSQSVTGTE